MCVSVFVKACQDDLGHFFSHVCPFDRGVTNTFHRGTSLRKVKVVNVLDSLR